MSNIYSLSGINFWYLNIYFNSIKYRLNAPIFQISFFVYCQLLKINDYDYFKFWHPFLSFLKLTLIFKINKAWLAETYFTTFSFPIILAINSSQNNSPRFKSIGKHHFKISYSKWSFINCAIKHSDHNLLFSERHEGKFINIRLNQYWSIIIKRNNLP